MAPSGYYESFVTWVGGNLLFSDFLESDQRVPFLTFRMPRLVLNSLNMDESEDNFALYAPSVEFWIALKVLLVIWSFISVILSWIMYKFIILPRKKFAKKKKDQQKNGGNLDMTLYFVGFGLIMPICVWWPYYEIRVFHIQNKVLKFATTLGPITTFFRVSEAMFGFLPTFVEDSLSNTMTYNAMPMEVMFDSKGPLKSSWGDVKRNLIKFVQFFFILGGYCSLLSPYDYAPYPSEMGTNLLDVNFFHGFSRDQLINNFLAAVIFQLYLTAFGSAIGALTSLCGVQQITMMLNPIFESTSPSDFWGRKWNLVVHGVLKRGVYKPVRSYSSRLVASIATFVASGVFHEWILSVIFLKGGGGHDGESCIPPLCFQPGYGRNTLFFVWNAIIIGLEYAIGGAAFFQLLKKHLPLTMISLLVASTALPMTHWFTGDYVRSDFFKDGQIGFPLVVKVHD